MHLGNVTRPIFFLQFITLFFLLFFTHFLRKLIVTVSCEELRDSVIHIYVSILSQTPLPSRLPHNIEQSPLCLTGLCETWFYINICMSSSIIFLSLLPAFCLKIFRTAFKTNKCWPYVHYLVSSLLCLFLSASSFSANDLPALPLGH